ncbi:GtrA family protein [Geminocystis sp. CENA526]|uniref:GtrA family protein n=1 Tax=Geminocystis sp. CENA526 TaxID=1355871 RepID=UPI003D6E13AE
MIEKIKSFINLRIFKFLGVGGFCAGLSLILMYGLTSLLQINYLISSVITIIITNFIGFALNKYYTFQTKKKLFWRELWKYYSVMLSSYIINLCAMFILVDLVNIWYLYANIILMIILTPLNYIFHKNWSFNKKKLPSK